MLDCWHIYHPVNYVPNIASPTWRYITCRRMSSGTSVLNIEYATSVDKKKKKKTRYKKLVTHVEPHASAVSLLKRAENSDI